MVMLGLFFCFLMTSQVSFAVAGGGGADYGGGDYDGGVDEENGGGNSQQLKNRKDSLENDYIVLGGFILSFPLCYFILTHQKKDSKSLEMIEYNIRDSMSMTLDKANQLLLEVEKCFITIQEAWSSGDLSQATSFYSLELYQRHQELLDEMKDNNEVNIVKDIVVEGFFKYLKYDEHRFSIGIQASLIDYTKNNQTNTILSGEEYLRGTISQIWEFEKVTEGHIKAVRILS